MGHYAPKSEPFSYQWHVGGKHRTLRYKTIHQSCQINRSICNTVNISSPSLTTVFQAKLTLPIPFLFFTTGSRSKTLRISQVFAGLIPSCHLKNRAKALKITWSTHPNQYKGSERFSVYFNKQTFNTWTTYRVASQFFTVANVSSIVVLHSVDMPCLNTCSDPAQHRHC